MDIRHAFLHRLPNTRPLAVFVIALLLATACDRNVEPFVEGEQPREPDLSRIFPEAAGAAPPGGGQRLGMGGAAARQGSDAEAAAAKPASAAAGEAIAGTIRLAEGAKGPAGGILFVIARTAGARGGPPLAVLRIPEPRFPLSYAIGPENVMIPSMQFAGSIELTARLDSDGNAMTKAATDLAADAAGAHAPGTTGVDLTLQ